MARTAVIAGTATAVSGSVSRHGQQKAAAQQQAMTKQATDQAAAQLQAQRTAAPAPALSTDDKIAKIKELGELKTAGLLTDEEFAAEKAKVLAL